VSCWYKPEELSKRIAFFYTASLVSGAFGGLLAGGLIEGMEGLGGIRGWKWLFMIEGAATVLIAIGAYFVLPSESLHSTICGRPDASDYPTTTKWLTEEEKILAVARLQVAAEHEEHMSHRRAFVEAIKDPKTWVSCSVTFVVMLIRTDFHAWIQRSQWYRYHLLLLPHPDDRSGLQGSNCSM
jgi:MFS family permease